MAYAVELFLRDDESQAIRQLFSTTESVLADIGARPHVSLAVFEDVDVSMLTDIVRSFAMCTAPLKLRFSSIGMFPGQDNVVFLAPVVTAALLEAHTALHIQILEKGLTSDALYRPHAWVPHCTITVEEPIDQSLETIRAVHATAVMGEYTIDTVSVVSFRPILTLASFALGSGKAAPLP